MTLNNLHSNTIVALSTAHGGALHIIRLSGSEALKIVQPFFSRAIIKPRYAYFGDFSSSQGVIDQVVITWFCSPASFTGEDSIEISCHGSRWIASEIIRLLIENGARSATAGEFTRRAFMNGKLDLSQAEAVGDLIAATSQASARVALSQMRGGYTQALSDARSQLLHICSMLELELDFGEEDVEFASREHLVSLLENLKERCSKLADSFALGNVLKNGIPVAIIGKPNVGKSTLLNALVGEQRAIVSDIAGTTRDYIEETVTIGGVEFRFIDTAGIRSTTDAIEAIGVERSMERMRAARIVVQLIDNEGFDRVDVSEGQTLIVVQNKSDLGRIEGCDVCISARGGDGLDDLRACFLRESGVGELCDDEVVVSNLRHYELLVRVLGSIDEALCAIDCGMSGDMIVASLGYGIESLGEITGELTTDEILGNIFRNFCIGK